MPTNHSDPSILAKFLSQPDGSKASSFIRALNQKWFCWEAASCRKYLIFIANIWIFISNIWFGREASCCKYLIFIANIWIFISNIWFRREASCRKYLIFKSCHKYFNFIANILFCWEASCRKYLDFHFKYLVGKQRLAVNIDFYFKYLVGKQRLAVNIWFYCREKQRLRLSTDLRWKRWRSPSCNAELLIKKKAKKIELLELLFLFSRIKDYFEGFHLRCALNDKWEVGDQGCCFNREVKTQLSGVIHPKSSQLLDKVLWTPKHTF